MIFPKRHPLLLLWFGLGFLSRRVLSQWAEVYEAGTQYIFYNGSISGIFQHPSGAFQGCHDYHLGPYTDTYLFAGVNGPWDPNSFFFELYHENSDYGSYWTSDSIYNLDFTSSGFVCEKDGQYCPSITEWPWYFVTAQVLDLSKTEIFKVAGGGEQGYTVRGNQSTWVSNGTVTNSVDITAPENTTADSRCMTTLQVEWSGNETFNYSVTFTNSTAAAELFINTTSGSLSLQFSGKRVNYPSQSSGSNDPPNSDIGSNATIELVTTGANPNFTYSNGSAIVFTGEAGSYWVARSSNAAQSNYSLSLILHYWVGLAVLFWVAI